jgi:hypothetical protein
MKLTILFVVGVGAILVWWLRSEKHKRSSPDYCLHYREKSEHPVQAPFMKLPTLVPRCHETKEVINSANLRENRCDVRRCRHNRS